MSSARAILRLECVHHFRDWAMPNKQKNNSISQRFLIVFTQRRLDCLDLGARSRLFALIIQFDLISLTLCAIRLHLLFLFGSNNALVATRQLFVFSACRFTSGLTLFFYSPLPVQKHKLDFSTPALIGSCLPACLPADTAIARSFAAAWLGQLDLKSAAPNQSCRTKCKAQLLRLTRSVRSTRSPGTTKQIALVTYRLSFTCAFGRLRSLRRSCILTRLVSRPQTIRHVTQVFRSISNCFARIRPALHTNRAILKFNFQSISSRISTHRASSMFSANQFQFETLSEHIRDVNISITFCRLLLIAFNELAHFEA